MRCPLLSIVVTTHDRPDTLLRTVASIVREIRVEKEIIIISDRGDFHLHSQLKEYLCDQDSVLFMPKLRGPAETRNLGIQMSRGELLILFDDDDEFPDFERFFSVLLTSALDSRGVLVYSDVEIRQEDRSNLSIGYDMAYRHSLKDRQLSELYVKNFILTPACVIPSFIAKQCSQDPFLRSLEDWDFLLNLRTRCDFRYVDTVGALVYKDFVNPGTRRSTTTEGKGFDLLLDYLYIYRRWPAPNQEIRDARSSLLKSFGFPVESKFL